MVFGAQPPGLQHLLPNSLGWTCMVFLRLFQDAQNFSLILGYAKVFANCLD